MHECMIAMYNALLLLLVIQMNWTASLASLYRASLLMEDNDEVQSLSLSHFSCISAIAIDDYSLHLLNTATGALCSAASTNRAI